MFRAMRLQSAAPDTITYTAWIAACDKGREPERALWVFREM